MTTSLPKIKFVLPTTKYEVAMLEHFSRSKNWNWPEYLFKLNIGLKEALKGTKTKQQRIGTIQKYVDKIRGEKQKELQKQVKEYQKEWNTINDKFMQVAADTIETNWHIKTIEGRVSLCTVNPRFLNQHAFGVWWKTKPDPMKRIAAHECVHFLYFKKFHEVFPEIAKSNYDGQTIVWALSEILAPIILNQPEFKKMLGRSTAYEQYERYKLTKTKTLIQYFTEFFNKYRKQGKSFEEILKLLYKKALKHKEEILSI